MIRMEKKFIVKWVEFDSRDVPTVRTWQDDNSGKGWRITDAIDVSDRLYKDEKVVRVDIIPMPQEKAAEWCFEGSR